MKKCQLKVLEFFIPHFQQWTLFTRLCRPFLTANCFCAWPNAAGNAYFSFSIPCVEEAAASVVTYPHPRLHGESNLPLERAHATLFIVSPLSFISDMTSQQSGITFRCTLGLSLVQLFSGSVTQYWVHTVHTVHNYHVV